MKALPYVPESKKEHSVRKGASYTIILLTLLCTACKNDMQKIQFFDQQTLPDQVVHDAMVRHSKEGIRQMLLEAPLVYKYSKPKPRTLYPEGIHVLFYSNGDTGTVLTAQYAMSLDEENVMMAQNNVVIIDYTSGDTTYLEDIIWNGTEGYVYSNHPVKSVNGNRVTYGDGFISDENFMNPKVYHQRGVIEWTEEE